MALYWKITTNHDLVKKWANMHCGKPGGIDDPDALGDIMGIRINFPGKEDEIFLRKRSVRDINWDQFFKVFEEQNLAFVYEDKEKLDDPVMSYRFVKRDLANAEMIEK